MLNKDCILDDGENVYMTSELFVINILHNIKKELEKNNTRNTIYCLRKKCDVGYIYALVNIHHKNKIDLLLENRKYVEKGIGVYAIY